MNRFATAALVSLAFLLGSAVGPVGSNAEGRPTITRCNVVAVDSTTLIDTLVPVRAGRIVTAVTTRCKVYGHRPAFDTQLTVEKFTDQPDHL